MKCDSRQLAAYALGVLDEVQSKAVEEHAGACPSCARELARLREMVGMLETLPEPESAPMDVEALWSKVMSQKTAAGRPARMWQWIVPGRRWAVALAAAACLAVLSFHYGVTVQVGALQIAFGGAGRATPASQEAARLKQELAHHLARHDEMAARVERTLVGLAHAIRDLDTHHRQELVGLRGELAAQRALDQTVIRKSFDLVASEMTDTFRKRQ